MLPETYELAVVALPPDIDENPLVPPDVEAEEDLGEVDDPDSNAPIEPLILFEVEVNGTESLEDDLTSDSESSSGSDSESEQSEEAKIEESRRVARVRKANTMLGFVKRGKYSK